ncbi:MAG: hypothetical protein ABIG73_02155 [Patescibacteria group bacterium]
MSKKTFYIILIILATLLIVGGLIWYFFFKPSAPAITGNAGFTVPGQETTAGLVPISEGPVVSARFIGDDILFYDFSGQLWQLKSGELKPSLSVQQIAENPKPGAKSIAFSPDTKKIAYYISDLKNNSLFISDADGKNQKTLLKNFQLRDVVLSWPKTKQLAIASRPSGLVDGGLWLFDVNTLKLTKIIDGLPGLETIFSPDGDNFIYSFVDQNGRNPILAVYRKGVSKNINNVSTLVEKCAWSNDSISIYCAVPKSWLDSAVLPDDYYKDAISTVDDIWKINTETGAKSIVFENMGDISNLAISGSGDNLIFILKNSEFLYKIGLQ